MQSRKRAREEDGAQGDLTEGARRSFAEYLVKTWCEIQDEKIKRTREEESREGEGSTGGSAGFTAPVSDLHDHIRDLNTQNRELVDSVRKCNTQLQKYESLAQKLKAQVERRMRAYIGPIVKFGPVANSLVRPEIHECIICKEGATVGHCSNGDKTMVCGRGLKQLREHQISTAHIGDNGGRITLGCNATMHAACWKEQLKTGDRRCPACRAENSVVEMESYIGRRCCLNCDYTSHSSEDLLKHAFECTAPNAWSQRIGTFSTDELYELAHGNSETIQTMGLEMLGITAIEEVNIPETSGAQTVVAHIAGVLLERTCETNKRRLHVTMELIRTIMGPEYTSYVPEILMLLYHCDVSWDKISPLGLIWGALKFKDPQPAKAIFDGYIHNHATYVKFLGMMDRIPKPFGLSADEWVFVKAFSFIYLISEHDLFRADIPVWNPSWRRTAEIFSEMVNMLIDNVTDPPNNIWEAQMKTPDMLEHVIVRAAELNIIPTMKMPANIAQSLVAALNQNNACFSLDQFGGDSDSEDDVGDPGEDSEEDSGSDSDSDSEAEAEAEAIAID